ncbi:hypothetical protein SEA_VALENTINIPUFF_57 [Microbacterium phage ValentiniPuff]|uniref:Uncharacterized protein n=1 Tax=Microbacterium phage ValentiniPuff TaxID=2315705 RepID=A0A386KQS4_9CAUD|nr:hypothetical protein SEA_VALENTINIPUFF_57 [Microbacterium phage ValentiniPuff]
MGISRGTERFGHIIADRISFTKNGAGLQLPEGVTLPVDAGDVAEAVEEYLLQLPGSGPSTMLVIDETGELAWSPLNPPAA